MSGTTPQNVHGSYLMPSLDHATVADAMHPGIMTCEPDAPVTEVARMMAGHHVHSIAVMGIAETHGEQLVWGIISDLDLLRAGTTKGAERTASEMAIEPIFTVEPTTPLRDATELMLSHGSTHVLVVDTAKQRPIGMLSTIDIVGILAWGEA
jgi:CBS domain-containing protein